MYDKLDYDKMTPIDIMNFLKQKKDKERINKILDLKIFKAEDGKLIIPSFKCTKTKQIERDTKNFRVFFPLPHQIFWFELMETKDIDFAISETKRILKGEQQYNFPNGTTVKLDIIK